VKIVLLAGGNSTRMAPYSAWTEKSLLPINGKPIIRIIIDRIFDALMPSDIIICLLGKYRDNFRWELRDSQQNIRFSEKVEAIGTATHYYYAAEKEFHFKEDDTVLIHYADALTELDYAHFLKVFEESGVEALVAGTTRAKHDYSEIVLEDTSPIADELTFRRVEEFHEKPELKRPTWTGIMLIKHRIMQREFGNPLFGKKVDFGYEILPKLTEKKKLYAYLYDGVWEDVGNLHAYSKAVEKYRGGSLFV
jgi:NDP-sugar pyrophosphorylase family protein